MANLCIRRHTHTHEHNANLNVKVLVFQNAFLDFHVTILKWNLCMQISSTLGRKKFRQSKNECVFNLFDVYFHHFTEEIHQSFWWIQWATTKSVTKYVSVCKLCMWVDVTLWTTTWYQSPLPHIYMYAAANFQNVYRVCLNMLTYNTIQTNKKNTDW